MIDNAMNLFFMTMAVVSYGFLFEVPKKEIPFCGIAGFLGWLTYLILYSHIGVIYATTVGAIIATYLAREFTYSRRMPLTVFLLPSLLPLAPGYPIYYAMFSTMMNNGEAFQYALHAIKIAGSIGIGVGIGLSFPSYARYKKATKKHMKPNKIKKRRRY